MKKTYDTVNVNGGFKGGWGGGGRLPIRSLFFPKSHHFRVKGLYKLCAFEINETVVINCLPPPPFQFFGPATGQGRKVKGHKVDF